MDLPEIPAKEIKHLVRAVNAANAALEKYGSRKRFQLVEEVVTDNGECR